MITQWGFIQIMLKVNIMVILFFHRPYCICQILVIELAHKAVYSHVHLSMRTEGATRIPHPDYFALNTSKC